MKLVPGRRRSAAVSGRGHPAAALTVAERAAERAAELRDATLSAERRSQEGIVHTPPVLARAIARLADEALRERLGLAGGLADPQLAVVDPACGPGAFLAAALAVGEGRGCVPAALIGYDRDPAAIASAKRALGAPLEQAGWPFALQARDPLIEVEPQRVAKLAPALCVLGNPPWIARAQARPSPWLRALLTDFERDGDGQPLRERKVGVLADAYVRFLRWSLEVARLARGGAVIALVTNGSYLDGPVHRGLRAMLLRELDALHVVDLGGNALLPRARERDDNVFGVRPQVAIVIGVRAGAGAGVGAGAGAGVSVGASAGVGAERVKYLRVRGALASKLERLAELSLGDADLQELRSVGPLYRLVPTATVGDEYGGWPSLPELFPFHREGVQTNRDAVVVDRDRAVLLARMQAFAAGTRSRELAAALAPLPHYDPGRARALVRAALAADPTGDSFIRPLHYRPHDLRWFVALAPLCHRPRPDLLAAMDCSTIALVSVRKDRGALPWTHATVATVAIDNCLLSTRSSCRARAFPSHAPDGSENLAAAAAAELTGRIGRRPTSEELIHYALAILSSPSFRDRYDAALRLDYAHVPWPPDARVFTSLSGAGRALAALQLRVPGGSNGRAGLLADIDAAVGAVLDGPHGVRP